MATSNKAFPIILIGVAALGVLAYVGMVNQPGDEVTGTVAPAQRYQAEQNNEIQLGDQSIQEVMQSDTFARLVTDDAFRDATVKLRFLANGQVVHETSLEYTPGQ